MFVAVNCAIFALIATVASIDAQNLIIGVWDGVLAVLVAVMVDSGVGFVGKYILDRRYIFRMAAA